MPRTLPIPILSFSLQTLVIRSTFILLAAPDLNIRFFLSDKMFTSSLLLVLGAAAASAVPCNTTRPGSGSGSGSSSGSGPSSGSYDASTLPAWNETALPNTPATNTSSGAVQCPVVLDGRVPTALTLADFDSDNGIFNPDYVKGNNVSWSDILLFPDGGASRFDGAEHKALEVTINNASIFMSQYGFRRAGLQFAGDGNENSTGWAGQRTLHWSVRQDAQRPFNLSHEYLNAWHEAADYSANQIMFQTGLMIDQPDLDAESYKIFDRNSTLLWSTPMEATEWQNFALNLDIDAKYVFLPASGMFPLRSFELT